MLAGPHPAAIREKQSGGGIWDWQGFAAATRSPSGRREGEMGEAG
jgi:hypothetical protein